MRTDFRNFYGLGLRMLSHSAKGSTWEEHKYIKRINGTYYYPDDYEGGRHLPSDGGGETSDVSKETEKLSEKDVEALAREVIRGNFGNGQVRKDLLGEFYRQVQDRVNEIYRESAGKTKISDVSDSQVESVEKIVEKVSEKTAASTTAKGLDYDTIFSVYKKRG